MYYRQCLRFLNAIFSFVYIHEGMTCGLLCRKVLTCGLVCRKVLRNTLFEFQSESQGRMHPQDTTHTFRIAMLDRATLSSNKRLWSTGCPKKVHNFAQALLNFLKLDMLTKYV